VPIKFTSSDLKSATARRGLDPRRMHRLRVARGAALGYRHNEDFFGAWFAIIADGKGGEQAKKIADADNFETANATTILDFDMAVALVQTLLRGDDAAEQTQSLAATIQSALADYKIDLLARSANPANATRVLCHLGPVLLHKPCALVSERELTDFRNGLVRKGRLKKSSINRLLNDLKAALTLACKERTHVWRAGLARLPNADKSRNKLFNLPDETICALVAEANARDAALGLLCEVLSETGTRPVQAARLKVAYLIAHPTAPRLLVARSAKGGGKMRVERKNETYPLPISVGLAAKLRKAAAGRAEDDPLLLRADGQPWNEKNVHADYRRPFAEIVKALGLNAKISAYCFRHSSICRQLTRGVHTYRVAANHDTSEAMIRKHYAKYITDHADEMTRAALLDHAAAPPRGNVVPLAR
jgi:integrase